MVESWSQQAIFLGSSFGEKIDRRKTSDALSGKAKRFFHENRIRTELIKDTTFIMLQNVESQLRLPQPNEQMRIRTQQQFNMIAIVMKIAMEFGTIDEISIATYTLNAEAYSILIDLVEKRVIKKLNLLLASSYSFRVPKQYEEMKKRLAGMSQNYDVHLVFAWLHFKITIAQCGNNFFHIEGSGNYSMNNMAEQLVFSNSVDLYEFDYEFMHNVIPNNGLKAIEVIC